MASNYLSTFAPNDVTVTIIKGNISHNVSGFSEDSIVSVELNAGTYSLYTGADDTNTRIFNANTAGTISLPLQQTSNSNDVLQMLYEADRNSRDSSGLFSILVKDNSGRSIFFAREAFISVVPNSSFGNSMQIREWQILAPKLDSYVGGNAKLTPEDAQAIEALGGNVADEWRA